MKNKLLIALSVLCLFTGCHIEKLGKDLSSGVSQNAEAIARNLMSGVNKGLSDSAFKANMYYLVDSLVGTAGGSANRSVKMLMDTLLSDKFIFYTRRLVEEASGEHLKTNVALLRNELLGSKTSEEVKAIVTTALNSILNDETTAKIAALRNELLGDATTQQLTKLRDSLLGPKTADAIKAIVDSAMTNFAYHMNGDVKKAVDGNASFIEKYAGRLLLLLGAIAVVIILVIWRTKQKYVQMSTLLASQINAIPDQKTYDELTTRIKEKAVETGVEPALRKVLLNNGLMGKESWEARQMKKGGVMYNKN